MKILLIDDDQLMLVSIYRKLQEKGHEVYTAANGMDALDMLAQHKIDLIISDIMMPDLSGVTLVSLMKQYHYGRIPLLFISSLNYASTIIQRFGLTDYDVLVKPIDYTQLLYKINSYDNQLKDV